MVRCDLNNTNFDTMTEETLETIILGHIAKELKDEIQIGRQVNLSKTIMQALRIHGVVGRSEQFTLEQMRQSFDAGAWEHHLHTFDSWIKTLK